MRLAVMDSAPLSYPIIAADEVTTATVEDLPDLQRLFDNTSRFTSASATVSKTLRDIAFQLADDDDKSAHMLRHSLLEIRARLIFSLADISVNLISTASLLISRTGRTLSSLLQSEQPLTVPGTLSEMVASMRKSCALHRRLLEQCLVEWDGFYQTLSHYQHARSRAAQGSFWRALGGFCAPAASSSSTKTPENSSGDSHVHNDFLCTIEALDAVDGFWQAIQRVFANAGISRVEMVRLQQSCQQFGNSYMHFVDPLSQCELDLSGPEPAITKSPQLLGINSGTRDDWRALLP